MELGGHAPALVLPDADVERATKVLAASKFRNAGQICVAPTRFIVHQDVHDEFISRLSAAVEAIKVGDGLADGTTMGPLANARRVHAMEDLIQEPSRRARVVTGGRRIGNKGYFFEPTVLSAVPREARAMNEEPFGPLALVVLYSSLSEAIAEANRLNYGLAAYGFTRSAEHAAILASSIESGMVSINHYGLALPEVPFGGVRTRATGPREAPRRWKPTSTRNLSPVRTDTQSGRKGPCSVAGTVLRLSGREASRSDQAWDVQGRTVHRAATDGCPYLL
jgi:succinate-semialdehyde dehydrogenase/glutarate-semialdehyde dehydrogenase